MNAGEVIMKLLGAGRLQEARSAGEEAVAADPHDDDALSALISVYLEIEAQCIATGVTGYLDGIAARIDELLPMLSNNVKQKRRHAELQLSLLPGYAELKSLEQLSARDGHEAEAYSAARALYDTGNMDVRLHEVYGTILYRYARVAMSGSSSRPVRALLLDYLALMVRKPSRLHSLMLRLAVRVARKFPDFGFVRFFELWNPRMLRPEDIIDPEGKSSLASAVVALIVDSDRVDELPDMIDRFPASAELRMSIVRDAFDGLISRNVKAGDTVRAIDLLELYSRHGALHAACRTHSHILKLALKVMTGTDLWRFVRFFINWDCSLLLTTDFEPTVNREGEPLPSLAARALDRLLTAVKADAERHMHLSTPILETLDDIAAMSPVPMRELVVRQRALLMALFDMEDEAFDRMSRLAADGGRMSPAFWSDFAGIAPTRELKLGVLALGILKQRSEKDPANDAELQRLTLDFAQLLHQSGNDDEAAAELERYRLMCADVAAEPIARYGAIKNTLSPDASPHYDNTLLYHRFAAEALSAIYKEVQSVDMSVLSNDGRVITAVSATRRPVAVDVVLWRALADCRAGDNIEVKESGGEVLMARKIGGKPYSALADRFAVVMDNAAMQILRRPDVVACANQFAPETIVKVSVYMTVDMKLAGMDPVRLPLADALEQLDALVAAVYSVDNKRVGYTTGPDGECGYFDAECLGDVTLGMTVKLYYYRDLHYRIKVLAAKPVDEMVAAVKTVSGRLCDTGHGEASVRDVAVSAELLTASGIDVDTYVTCKAYYVPSPDAHWQAIQLSTYS